MIGAVSSAGNPGDPDSVTTFDVFAVNYQRFADSVATLNTKVVAFTIPDVTQIPFTSQGQHLLVPQDRRLPGRASAASRPTTRC